MGINRGLESSSAATGRLFTAGQKDLHVLDVLKLHAWVSLPTTVLVYTATWVCIILDGISEQVFCWSI